MIGKLFSRWIRPRRVEDPLFGRLRANLGRSHWSGELVFVPLNARIALLIQADETGPGETQRALYRQLERRWSELRTAVAAALYSFQKEILDEELTDVWGVYKLAEIEVPREETPDMQWRLSFESAADDNHLYVVDMEGWEPTGAVTPEG